MTAAPHPELAAAVARGRPIDALRTLAHAAAWADAVLAEHSGSDVDALELVIALDDAFTALTTLGDRAQALAERAVAGPELADYLDGQARALAADIERLTAVRLDVDAERQLTEERAALSARIETLQPVAELVDALPTLRAVHAKLVARVGDGDGSLNEDARAVLGLAADVVARAGAAPERNGTGE